MEKQFEKLSKAQEKKEKAKLKKKKKRKSTRIYAVKKINERRKVMNDYKFFKGLKIEDQKKILDKLRDINKFTSVENHIKLS